MFIDDNNLYLIQRLRHGNAWINGAVFFRFVNLVDIRARLRVHDIAEVETNLRARRRAFGLRYLKTRHAIACALRHRSDYRRVGIFQQECEFVGGQPSAAVEGLRARKRSFAFQRTLRGIRVHELGLRNLARYNRARRGNRLAFGINRRRLQETRVRMRQRAIVGRHIQQLLNRIVGIRSNTIHVQRFIGLDRMRCLSILVKRQLKRVAAHVSCGVLHFGMQCFTRRGLYRELEIKRLVGISGRIETLGHIERLRNRQRSRNFNRQLAVVAQMRNNRRRGRGRRLAVPLRVQHVSRRAGDIFRLRLREFIDIRQTCRAGLEVSVAIGVVRKSARKLLGRARWEAHDFRLRNGSAAFAHRKEMILVVMRSTRRDSAASRRLRARFISINRGIAREVVICIALRRIEVRNRIAQRGTRGERIRVEIHLAVFGIVRNVFHHGFIGARNKRKRIGLNARREENAQRIRIAYRHSARSFVHIEVAQRNKARGNLHLNLIAHRHIARFRHGDHDIAQARSFAVQFGRARKCVGVGGIGRGFRHVAKHMVVHRDRFECVNLHVRAQRVVERDVAIAHLKALASIGGIARALHDFLRDVFEDFRELARARSRLIEVGTFSAIAEAPIPLVTPPVLCIGIGSGRIVARHGLHELVFVGGCIHIGARVRAIKNADGIHRSARVFHGFRGDNSVRGNPIREFTLSRRRTIGKENHNLFCIGTLGGLTMRKLHASSRIRSTRRFNGVDGVFKRALRRFAARRHVFHDLAVVVCVPTLAIRVVANLI